MWNKYTHNPARTSYDRDAARELMLYVTSDSRYNPYGQGMGRNVAENLRKKMRKGDYNPAQAPKAWEYVVAAAAKSYVKEFGEGEWSRTFNATTRRAVAEQMADEFEIEERIRGNLK